MKFRLRIPQHKVLYYAGLYSSTADKDIEPYGTAAKRQRYLTRKQLFEICHWKSHRRAELSKGNSQAAVKEISRFAFSAKTDHARIGGLMLLAGVKMPTASVILHFCVDSHYPILDVRALWSLTINRPSSYRFDFWLEYVEICQNEAKRLGITVRTLDKALWQYSRCKQ